MPVHNNNIKTNKHSNNIFELMEGMIDQLNNTKRLFIVMILTVMIIPPLVFIITFELINCYSSSMLFELGRQQIETTLFYGQICSHGNH